jgi:hypothetical protein
MVTLPSMIRIAMTGRLINMYYRYTYVRHNADRKTAHARQLLDFQSGALAELGYVE